MANYITAFFGSSLVNKSFLREGGILTKAERQNSFFTGTAIKIPCETLEYLQNILVKSQDRFDFCISLGYHEQVSPNTPYKVVKKDDLSASKLVELGIEVPDDYADGDDYVDNNGMIVTARLKNKMKQSHFTLFDYDSKGNDLSIEDWKKEVSAIIPQFETCGKLITASNSARVGYESSNFHVYTKLTRTNGLLEFGKNLGSHLEGKLDTSTFSRERVIYEGCPHILNETTPPANIVIEGDGSALDLISIIPKEGSRKDQQDKGLSAVVLDDTGIDIFEKIKLDNRNYASLYEMRDEIKELDQNHSNGNSSSDSNIRCWVTHLRPESKSQNGKIWNQQGLPIIRDYNDQGVPVNYTLGEDDELSRLIWWFDDIGAAQFFFNEIQEINRKNRRILDIAEEDEIRRRNGEEEGHVELVDNDPVDINDCFTPIRLGQNTFHVPKEISNNEHLTLQKLDNLGANNSVCRVIINRIYRSKSKYFTVDVDGAFIEQTKESLFSVIGNLYGFPIEDFDPTDKADKARLTNACEIIIGYVNSFNTFNDDELEVDMFCDHFKLNVVRDSLASTTMFTSYPYQPAEIPYLYNTDSYHAIVEDYHNHYPDVDKILDFIVHSRFAPNTRTSMMWFKAQSGWGKSLLFENLEDLGLMFRFQNNDDFIKTISGSPFGIKKGDFVSALGFFVDEFDRVTKELKSIDSKININPKHDRPFSLTTYSKIFVSHQEVAGLSAGVDTELGNRFVYENPEDKGLITNRKMFNENRGEYKQALSHWLAVEMNARVAVMVDMGRLEAEKFATQQLAEYFETNSLRDRLGSLDTDVEMVVDDIRYAMVRMWDYRLSLESSIQIAPDDKELIEIFHTNTIMATPVNDEFKDCIFIKSLDKFVLTFLHHNYKYDKGLLLAMKRRKKEIKEKLTLECKMVRFENGKLHRVSIVKKEVEEL